MNPGRQRYDWGSTTALQHLVGEPVDGRPLAELWYGTHSGAPASVGEQSLLEANGNRPLPFLVKLLAAARPLSIQCHPSRAQAEAGFDREEAAGIPVDDRTRTYRDRSAKPEILVALTPFRALCGMRDPMATAALYDRIGHDGLAPFAQQLRRPNGLAATFGAFLTMAPGDVAHVTKTLATQRAAAVMPWIATLADANTGDRGVLVATLLNFVELGRHEAVFLDAGNVHAYLDGVGLEVLAASDNVIRGGLTSKHVDVAELLKVADVRPLAEPVVRGVETRVGCWTYPVPVGDFSVTRFDVDTTAELRLEGPQLLVCTSGHTGPLSAGQVGWVTHDQGPARFQGPSTLFAISAGA